MSGCEIKKKTDFLIFFFFPEKFHMINEIFS